MEQKPIKRNPALKSLSREHHHALLLCWKIRTGIKKNVETIRIKKYVDWFYQNHLSHHFEVEEKHIFPILGNENKLIKQALAEHRRLKRLFGFSNEIPKNLNFIEKELEAHIRFEERVLFNEIQNMATEEQLEKMQHYHDDAKFCDNLADIFWEK